MSTTDTTEPIEEPTISIAEIMETPDMPLAADKRCDRCGAQAYIEVETLGGGNLLFCAHHYKDHEDALKVKAKRIIDHRGVLASEEVPTL